MNGLYRMFLGDARPNHPGDEWVFQDVDSIQDIIIPAARIALKVHQVPNDLYSCSSFSIPPLLGCH